MPSDDFAFPPDDSDEYLIALGRLTQGYRALDMRLLGVAIRYFGIGTAHGLAIFGPGDPKRKMDAIRRMLQEAYRDPEAEAVLKWKAVTNKIDSLVKERNNIIHSHEMSRDQDQIVYLRLTLSAPTFQKGQYQHHKGFSYYTPAQITAVAQKMYVACDDLSDALRSFQETPPPSP